MKYTITTIIKKQTIKKYMLKLYQLECTDMLKKKIQLRKLNLKIALLNHLKRAMNSVKSLFLCIFNYQIFTTVRQNIL